MALKTLGIKPVYITDEDSIFDEFYKPALATAARYDRAVGYFSSTMLALALQGVGGLASSTARMRLVIGDDLDDDEYRAVKNGRAQSVTERLSSRLNSILSSPGDALLQYRLEILSLMVATGRLEIKYALRRKGIFHQKVGIVWDELGDCVVFQGSANETAPGLLPSFNSETVSVYPSWKEEIFLEYGQRHVRNFERVWSGDYPETITLNLPGSDYESLRKYRRDEFKHDPYQEQFLIDALFHEKNKGPIIPKYINGQEYFLKDHQKSAIEEWVKSDYRGLMVLATGAGKTITAIHAAVKIYEALTGPLILLITVPYQILADQWCEEMKKFNIDSIRCWGGEGNWKKALEERVANLSFSNEKDILAVVCVNKTFFGDSFQKSIGSIPKNRTMLFVADECHRVASEGMIAKLPKNANLRLGLSATPWSKKNRENSDFLKSYFGPVVAKYTIDQALDDGVLCAYNYYPHAAMMSPDEEYLYEEISVDIARLMASLGLESPDFRDVRFQALFSRRARLIGSLESKFKKLDEIAENVVGGGVLVYCGDGSSEDMDGFQARDLTKAARVLSSRGLEVSRITAEETTKERREILAQFIGGKIDAIAAIRVLDEGFDLPYCREAFLLASGRNERQFIQRRGRVLRKMAGKDIAVIHDFICCPITENPTPALKKLAEEELRRGYEFSRVSSNKQEATLVLREFAETYGVDFELLVAEEEGENDNVFE